MKLYHQTGHNCIWNKDSLVEDQAGDGLILSPVNMDQSKISDLSDDIKMHSFFDPQFYMPKDAKGKLSSYDFFPANLINNFQSSDFETSKDELAKQCIDFQISNNFEYVIIPTRYFEDIPADFYDQVTKYFIEPYLNYFRSINVDKKILLTCIVKQTQLLNDESRAYILNWLSSFNDLSGFYLIFENDFQTKQIKHPTYLVNALKFIYSLRANDFTVNIGYNNTEGILYSVADPSSISMGSYDNLRQFGIKRFVTSDKKQPMQPNPRLYSKTLFQFIDYRYLDALSSLYKDGVALFEDSRYQPLMFNSEYNWHFTKSEPYKHFFLIFQKQLQEIPIGMFERINYLKDSFRESIELFKHINEAGVFLDENSDGSHLSFWLTSLSMFEKYLQDN